MQQGVASEDVVSAVLDGMSIAPGHVWGWIRDRPTQGKARVS